MTNPIDIQLGRYRVSERYYQMLDDGRVECRVCPRRCKLGPDQRGFCFVRARHDDGMVLTTFGRASGFCIDPIEKKPLHHFLPGTPVLSFGTAGCNLSCKFCQNHEISKARAFDAIQEVATPDDIARTAAHHGCHSVAYTYNDPVIFLEYVAATAKACHAQNIANVAVTAGYIERDVRADFFASIDAVNLDLKAFTEGFYRKLCTASLQVTQETAAYLVHDTDIWVELTNLIIPGENDDPEEINAMCDWVKNALGPDVPIHFTAFHPDHRMLDKPRTPPATLHGAYAIAKQHGLRYAYTGNIHDPPRNSTYCPGCGACVIGRDWHKLSLWGLDNGGACRRCGTALAGRFLAEPGRWGRKRQKVQIKTSHELEHFPTI